MRSVSDITEHEADRQMILTASDVILTHLILFNWLRTGPISTDKTPPITDTL